MHLSINFSGILFSTLLLVSVSCSSKKSIRNPDVELLRQAQQLAGEILITDGHIDFPYHFRHNYGSINESNANVAIKSPRGEFDWIRAKEGGLDAPFMSIYIPASYQETGGAKALADSLIDFVEEVITRFPDKYAPGRSPDEIEKN